LSSKRKEEKKTWRWFSRTGKIQAESTAKKVVRTKENTPFSALLKPLLLQWFAPTYLLNTVVSFLPPRKISVKYLNPKYFTLQSYLGAF